MKQIALALVLLVLAVPAFAQAPVKPTPVTPTKIEAPTVPVLPRVDSVTLENHLLKVEITKRDADKAQADFQAFLKTLDKPGFVIQRQQDGSFVYAVAPPPEPVKK